MSNFKNTEPTQHDIAMDTFRKELAALLNKYNKEIGSNTPDFILAGYLIGCLEKLPTDQEAYNKELLNKTAHKEYLRFQNDIKPILEDVPILLDHIKKP